MHLYAAYCYSIYCEFLTLECTVRLTIFSKLFISLFSLSVILILAMSLSINNSFKTGFQSYLNKQEKEKVQLLATELLNYYDNGWSNQITDHRVLFNLFSNIGEVPLPEPRIRKEPLRAHNPDNPLTPLANRITLLDLQYNVIWGPPLYPFEEGVEFATIPLIKGNKTIGWLKIRQRNIISGPLVESFYQQQRDNFYWIISLAGLITLFVSAFLVNHFLRPLKELHKGAKSLANGEYEQQIKIKGTDEFAEVSQAFNSLATSLKEQKKTREQWITDISHELRTPISVLRSELEAIQDGIRQPESKYINSMHNQVLGLGKLVDDLYLLSRSDTGILDISLHRINLLSTIDQVVDNFSVRIEEKGLTLKKYYDPTVKIQVLGDQSTLQQLMNNLLENSLRYTDAPGELHISVIESSDVKGNEQVKLVVEDSAPTVNVEQLPRLFERLYRVDQSRSRELGGSGLGLSICQNIIQKHQGDIQAYQSGLGGIRIEVLLKKQ